MKHVAATRVLLVLGCLRFVEGCEGPSSDPDVELCDLLAGYTELCTSDSCDLALARDCRGLEATLHESHVELFASCMHALGNPMQCLGEALELTPTRPAVDAFAAELCLQCGDGSTTCVAGAQRGSGDEPLERAGRLARALSPAVLEDVERTCTDGPSCADTFEACALDVVARSLPNETTTCLFAALLDGTSEGCEPATAGATSDDGESTDDTGPAEPSDAGDAEDDDAEDDDACVGQGCPCGPQSGCEAPLQCIDGVCGSTPECADDPNEPNDDEAGATYLPPIGDNDDQGSTVVGLLDSPSDVDWYRYQGNDNLDGLVNPTAFPSFYALRTCIHIECLDGIELTDVECPAGTVQEPSPLGRPGCCATNVEALQMHFSCGPFLTDASAYVYMQVSGAEAGICQEYSLGYHF